MKILNVNDEDTRRTAEVLRCVALHAIHLGKRDAADALLALAKKYWPNDEEEMLSDLAGVDLLQLTTPRVVWPGSIKLVVDNGPYVPHHHSPKGGAA